MPKPPNPLPLSEKALFTKISEVKVDMSRRLVTGYASTWHRDSGQDKIFQGAYKRTIQENFVEAINKYGAPEIRILWQHDIKEPIGVLLDIKEDDYGLMYTAFICETRLGNDVLILLSKGAVNKNSIGYATNATRQNNGDRDIKDIDLFEISFVSFPMNDFAYVLGLKEKEDRKALGISNMEVKAHTIRPVLSDIEWKAEAEEIEMPKEVKKGAVVSRDTAMAIAKPLQQIVQVLGAAGHTINWESGEVEHAGHDSHDVANETEDPMEKPAAESIAERTGARANPNPKTPDKPGVENGQYSPTLIENPMGARIKSVHGVISSLSCAKCGTELKCSGCQSELAAYHPPVTGSADVDPAGQKDITGVRASFKCATCGSAMKCTKCDDMGGMDTASNDLSLAFKNLLESFTEEKDSEYAELKNEFNELKMFLENKSGLEQED